MLELCSGDVLDSVVKAVTIFADAAADAAAAAVPEGGAPLSTNVQIDWIGETIKGGFTALAQMILLAICVVSVVERYLRLQVKNFIPADLIQSVLPLWEQGQYNCILAYCTKMPSLLSDMIAYAVENRYAGADIISSGALDIAGREMKAQAEKSIYITFTVAMEPMLGLLGTMIGMIEAFKLVEVYGDEGGASMLAGSISKALITTAVGLIVALPATGVYGFLKVKMNKISNQMEEEFDKVITRWLVIDPPEQTDAMYSVDELSSQIVVKGGHLISGIGGTQPQAQ